VVSVFAVPISLAENTYPRYQQPMNKVLFLVCVFLCSTVLAQETKTNAPVKIAAAEAKKHVGEEAIVTGTVAEINRIERLTRLNIDKPYPNQSMTLIIFSDKTNLFPEIDKFQGKKFEATGKITDYRGRPEIILSNTNQLRSADEQSSKEGAEKSEKR
jgi:DNA/RNA endonuclease YhcR with UshA esterase domain